MRKLLVLVFSFVALALSACSTTPPSNPNNLCSVFQEKDSWYVAAHKVRKKYNVPINVATAILYEDSNFFSTKKDNESWFFFIPYSKDSQSSDQTISLYWDNYLEEEGNFFSSEDNFEDALDFIGWYIAKTSQYNNIDYNDAYNQYLNYHEGWQNYKIKTYLEKIWLLEKANNVKQRSDEFKEQLLKCELY